ncbi:MAG: dNTP triphosphohydrolase [Bacteroidetes bacterium]|nr:dNTP triphosphohydrolase [Bacteroidota bacterium]MBS1540797.1 dNTP triphosphohydrolase [Bacteroidota bacterium]
MNWPQLLSPQRLQSKTDQHDQSRSAFEQDYDRIIFSHPFRRLQDKTQVHPLPVDDFVHTRLTHSLEVSSVGRSLGKKVGEEILKRHISLNEKFSLFDFGAIVAAASLAHDLGNPPFGHAGEEAISDFFTHQYEGQSLKPFVTESEWVDLTKFEGNAQGFRLLNQKQYGLRLTSAMLGAFTKYPCPAFFPERDKSRKSQKKFGFFESEKEIFEQLALELGLIQKGKSWSRHPLAFLVEAADDICYGIIDLEDGCRLGLVSEEETVALMAVILKEQFDRAKLNKLVGRTERLGVLRALTINKLVDECVSVFLEEEPAILNGNFDRALTDVIPSAGGLKSISQLSVEKIYRARSVVEIEAGGHVVLPGLLREFIAVGQALQRQQLTSKQRNMQYLLPEEIRWAIGQQPENTYHMLRWVIDFISGLTDRHALSLYHKITGG